MSKKQNWTEQEWIAFGNRVKQLRKDIIAMALDVQQVCRKPQVEKLLSIERELGKWRSAMEDIVAKDVSPDILTRIFYGDPLPIEQPVMDEREDAAVREDAARYRWLRSQHWNESSLAVVSDPKNAVKLGRDLPAWDRLDEMIDQAMKTERNKSA